MTFESSLSRSPYRLLRTLGEGRSGVVLEVAHREDGRTLALKLFGARDDASLARIRGDFDALARLAHPNLVALHELFLHEDRLALAMELVPGVDIIRFLRGTPPPPEMAIERGMLFGQIVQPLGESAFTESREAMDRLRSVIVQVARGLAALHARGHVHGDLRPSNVLVTPSGRAVLIDLLSEHAPSDPARFAGTSAYMAPEHGTGEIAGPPSDLYSLGVLIFEALTGELPFSGSGREVFIRKNTVSAPRAGLLVRDVPNDLDELCANLLDRRKGSRKTAEEVVEGLGGF